MPRFEVEPGQLTNTSGRQQALGGRVLEVCGQLEATAMTAADAAGEAGAAGSIAGWASAWSGSLGAMAASMGGLAGNLGSAADAYLTTDQQAVPTIGDAR
jgi:hypothetical protein